MVDNRTPCRPNPRPAAAIAGALIVVAVTVGTVALIGNMSGEYGWALFVVLPMSTGAASSWVALACGYRGASVVAGIVIGVGIACGVVLSLTGIEGVVCLIMVSPLWVPVTLAGAGMGWAAWQAVEASRYRVLAWFGLALLSPAMLGLETAVDLQPPVYKVTSYVIVDAPPETVWPQVIAFAELPEPDEFVFRHGVAYPIRAEIEGVGIGAKRLCVFSTGAFVEPITQWNPPHVLAFDVVENPPALEEWSPWGHIEPPHTHGYFESHRGRFDLERLPNGRTKLIGTTWYQHGLWPASYWRLWSDHIIHMIHHRVLGNIKQRAERQPAARRGRA